jgi:hypothetical protein
MLQMLDASKSGSIHTTKKLYSEYMNTSRWWWKFLLFRSHHMYGYVLAEEVRWIGLVSFTCIYDRLTLTI